MLDLPAEYLGFGVVHIRTPGVHKVELHSKRLPSIVTLRKNMHDYAYQALCEKDLPLGMTDIRAPQWETLAQLLDQLVE